MKRKTKKVFFATLLIVIALPVALIRSAFSCFSMVDKTNGAIVSSGVTRRYLLLRPENLRPVQSNAIGHQHSPRGDVACGPWA